MQKMRCAGFWQSFAAVQEKAATGLSGKNCRCKSGLTGSWLIFIARLCASVCRASSSGVCFYKWSKRDTQNLQRIFRGEPSCNECLAVVVWSPPKLRLPHMCSQATRLFNWRHSFNQRLRSEILGPDEGRPVIGGKQAGVHESPDREQRPYSKGFPGFPLLAAIPGNAERHTLSKRNPTRSSNNALTTPAGTPAFLSSGRAVAQSVQSKALQNWRTLQRASSHFLLHFATRAVENLLPTLEALLPDQEGSSTWLQHATGQPSWKISSCLLSFLMLSGTCIVMTLFRRFVSGACARTHRMKRRRKMPFRLHHCSFICVIHLSSQI